MQLGPKDLHLLRARRSAGAPPPQLEQVHGPGRREHPVHRRLAAGLGRRPRGRVHRAALVLRGCKSVLRGCKRRPRGCVYRAARVHRCLPCACACACAFALTSRCMHAACARCMRMCMCMCTLHVHVRAACALAALPRPGAVESVMARALGRADESWCYD